MPKTRMTRAALGIALVALVASPAGGQPQDTTADWMKLKLGKTQDILAGLTLGNLDRVVKASESIGFITYFEKWPSASHPEYKRQLEFFKLANQELSKQAKAGNLDGATLAYTQLTVSCVQCHKIVRDAKK